MLPSLEELARNDKDVFLRKINIDTWKTEVAKQHKVSSVPNIRVFDRKGQLRGEPTGNLSRTQQLIGLAK